MDVNAQQALECLNIACEKGHIEIVRLLLDKGVDVNAKEVISDLSDALKFGYTEIAELLNSKEIGVSYLKRIDTVSNLPLEMGTNIPRQGLLDCQAS